MKFDELFKMKDGNGKDVVGSYSRDKIVELYKDILGIAIAKNDNDTDFSKLIYNNREEYKKKLENLLLNKDKFFEIMFDIFIKDGNSMMSGSHFSKLYEEEGKKLKELSENLNIEELSDKKRVYLKCVEVAVNNDDKLSSDEQNILNTLGREMGLSKEEIKILDFYVLKKIQKAEDILVCGASSGVLLYNGKKPINGNIFVPDEVVEIMREIRGKKIADKHFRLLLWNLNEHNDKAIKELAKSYGIKGKETSELIQNLIEANIDFHRLIIEDFPKLYDKEGIKGRDLNNFVKDTLNDLIEDFDSTKGTTANEKIDNLIAYFKKLDEKEAKISNDGYQNLLKDFKNEFKDRIKENFELEKLPETTYDLLQLFIDLNIKPSDLLFSLSLKELNDFLKKKGISNYGISSSMIKIVNAILNHYMNEVDVYIENYVDMANQRYGKLDGVDENNIGQEFEKATAEIFKRLGFEILDKPNDCKVDILIEAKGKTRIIECKTKGDGLLKNSTDLLRQVKDYVNTLKLSAIVIAPEFSEKIIKEFGNEEDISLLTAKALKDAYDDCCAKEITEDKAWDLIWSKCIGK